VTRDVRDTKGKRVDGKLDDNEDNDEGDSDGRANEAYRKALGDALRAAGIQRDGVAAASLFTRRPSRPSRRRSARSCTQHRSPSRGRRADGLPMSSVAGSSGASS